MVKLFLENIPLSTHTAKTMCLPKMRCQSFLKLFSQTGWVHHSLGCRSTPQSWVPNLASHSWGAVGKLLLCALVSSDVTCAYFLRLWWGKWIGICEVLTPCQAHSTSTAHWHRLPWSISAAQQGIQNVFCKKSLSISSKCWYPWKGETGESVWAISEESKGHCSSRTITEGGQQASVQELLSAGLSSFPSSARCQPSISICGINEWEDEYDTELLLICL